MTDVTNIGPMVVAWSAQLPSARSEGSVTPRQSPAFPQGPSVSKAELRSIAEEVQREQLKQAEPPAGKQTRGDENRNKQIQEAMAKFNRSVNFRVDQDTGMTVLTVRDKTTSEVIRQIPPDAFLTLVSRLDEMRGIFFEDMA
jgi:flagellar protein FlaG